MSRAKYCLPPETHQRLLKRECRPSRRLGAASASPVGSSAAPSRGSRRRSFGQRQAVHHGWQLIDPSRSRGGATPPGLSNRSEKDDMTRALLVGLPPDAVDYSHLPYHRPWTPSIDVALKKITDRGWQAD